MPVVLPDATATEVWADPDAAESTLRDLLAPAADELIEAHPIGSAVNRPQNDGLPILL